MLEAVGAGGVSAQRITQAKDHIERDLKMVAVPVVLPEPGINTASHAGFRVIGYTEQQVLALLAKDLDAVNLDRLGKALTKLGHATWVSQEEAAADIPRWVNALTSCVLEIPEAAPQPQADALDAESWVSESVTGTPFLQDEDQHLLDRFIETTEDNEGFDIGKEAIKRLANLGVVESLGFGRYGVTIFGYWVHEHYWYQNPSLPLKTNLGRDADARAAIAKATGREDSSQASARNW